MLINLEKYGVSKDTGFVPAQGTQKLPVYYKPWEDVARGLSIKLNSGTFSQELDLLPALSVDHLCDEHQWQRAYILLAFLIHALVHGSHRTTVPAVLSVPFLAVCDHLGLRPVLSYAGLCLYNWATGGDEQVLQGLEVEMSFTGTQDEAAFYLVPVLVELAGGRLPALMLKTLIAAGERDWSFVSRNLETCTETIATMTVTLGQLSLCHPQVFYHQIRPYIAGLDVDFERADDSPLHVKQPGGSAVQSSLFMFIDHVLGVAHDNPMLEDMRLYMPRGHRRLLEEISAQPSLTDLMEIHDAPSDVLEKLAVCRNTLQSWRSRHIAVVMRYIVLPAQAAAKDKNKEAVQVAGTAGSSPLRFLKQLKEDTTLNLNDRTRPRS